ncbi:MAG: tripartite tricarboxylate transporter TctB family protein [Pseudomonadota bacterium]|nr:tripartite tricarboxylate transporter TctB family protein [Pseudomonadota bacterium]
MNHQTGPHKADAVMAVLLGAVAVAILWQARGFTAFASIFPKAVGAALLLCCALLLLRIWRQRARAQTASAGGDTAVITRGLLRSGALVAVLVVWVALLETAGFTLTSSAGFLALALIAERDAPSLKRSIGYAVIALVVVLLLQLLFQRGLDVRLPAGVWLPGLFR